MISKQVIASALGQLPEELISLVFSKFSKLPSSLRDSGNFVKTLKILAKLILNCPRPHAITYTHRRPLFFVDNQRFIAFYINKTEQY